MVANVHLRASSKITDETHTALREQGAIVEEALSDGDDDDENNEKALPHPPEVEDYMDEKAGIPVPHTNGFRNSAVAASWDSAATSPDGRGVVDSDRFS